MSSPFFKKILYYLSIFFFVCVSYALNGSLANDLTLYLELVSVGGASIARWEKKMYEVGFLRGIREVERKISKL